MIGQLDGTDCGRRHCNCRRKFRNTHVYLEIVVTSTASWDQSFGRKVLAKLKYDSTQHHEHHGVTGPFDETLQQPWRACLDFTATVNDQSRLDRCFGQDRQL